MARSLRLQYPGALYHVMARGNQRQFIFRGSGDYLRFLDKLASVIEECAFRLYAYALLPNHYHLLLETPRGNLSAGMQRLQSSYTAYHNVRHHRVGHLFSGRFKAPLVEADDYLLNLTRYIHLNPVETTAMRARGLKDRLQHLREFRWSSYRAYAGLARQQEWVDYAPLRRLVARGERRQQRAYREYVEAGLAQDDEQLRIARSYSSKAIGSEAFCAWADEQYRKLTGKQGSLADVAMRRIEVPLNSDLIMAVVVEVTGCETREFCRPFRNSVERDVLIRALIHYGGLTQRAVGQILGHRDGGTVSRRLRDLRDNREQDRKFRRYWQRICRRLDDEITNYKA